MDFKFRLGQIVFFHGRDDEMRRCSHFNPEKIYEGKIVRREQTETDLTPEEWTPTPRERRTYLIECGVEKTHFLVAEEKLVLSPQDLLPKLIVKLDQPVHYDPKSR